MPTRRWVLGAACAAGVGGPGLARAGSASWARWLSRHADGGRIVDRGQGGISHSEGQGYALLLAQAHGDRAAFERIEAWTARHMAVRRDRLMAWKWRPGPGDNIADWHNATDGDLFRAWALLRAGRDSGWAGHAGTAIAIARDIADLCLAPDPRTGDDPLILPGAESRRDAGRVLVNPSYVMPRALRELGQAAGDARLVRAADHGETLLAELAATGFLPNWVDVTSTGLAPPADRDARWGYDALRIPLYLAWSGGGAHPAVAVAARLMDDATHPGHVAVESWAPGTVLAQSNRAGFRAVRALADCRAFAASDSAELDYYSETLLCLAELARREGECRDFRQTQ